MTVLERYSHRWAANIHNIYNKKAKSLSDRWAVRDNYQLELVRQLKDRITNEYLITKNDSVLQGGGQGYISINDVYRKLHQFSRSGSPWVRNQADEGI